MDVRTRRDGPAAPERSPGGGSGGMGRYVVVAGLLVVGAVVSLAVGLVWLVPWGRSASAPDVPSLSLPTPDPLGPASQVRAPGLATDAQLAQAQGLADELLRAVADRRMGDARRLLPAGRYGRVDVAERFADVRRSVFAPVASWNLGRDRIEVRAVLVTQDAKRANVVCTRWAVDLGGRTVVVVGEVSLGDTGADADLGILARRVERDCRERVVPA